MISTVPAATGRPCGEGGGVTAPVRVAVSVRPHKGREDRAPAMPVEGPLVDRYGRVHDDLRISVTDRCNLRCVYCMPEEGLSFLRMDQLLTFDEITRVARAWPGVSASRRYGSPAGSRWCARDSRGSSPGWPRSDSRTSR